MEGKISDTLNTLLSHQKTIMTPVKLFVLIIAVLILGACSDELTPVEAIDLADPVDYAKIYMEKSKTRQLDITLEEFIELAKEQESIRLLKTESTWPWPWPDPPPVWESDYGTKVNLMDDSSIRKSIGFGFKFYGKKYWKVWINSNGNLTFNGSFPDFQYPYKIPVKKRAFLGPLYGDFNPDYRDGYFGKVYYNRLGAAPNRRFVVTWDAVPEWGWGGSYTFQVTLFEGSNQILFSYNGLNFFGSSTRQYHKIGLNNKWTYSHKKTIIASGLATKDFDGKNVCVTPQGNSYTWSYGACEPPLNSPPEADAGSDQIIECQGANTSVTLNGVGTDPDGDDLTYEWTLNGNIVSTDASFDSDLSLGTHTFTLKVTDPAGESDSDDVDITIEDTTPPEVTFELIKDKLWPANHKMVLVASGISASDICCETSLVVDVTCNEPSDGNGAGNTEPDWEVVDNGDGTFEVYLRAERAGGGDDRIYTITANAEDCSDNLAIVSRVVTVPHDKGKKK